MAVNPRDGKLLYHLTAIDNIDSILENGLLPREAVQEGFTNVANPEILKSRAKFDLAKFTPFHFLSQSPFAGSAQKSNLETEFLYITIKRSLAESNKFQIVPRHPLNFDGEPLEWEEGMEAIDWELLGLRDYTDYDCKEACMAECLFSGRVLPQHFHALYVRTEEVKSKIMTILQRRGISIRVNVNPGMFIRK